MPEKEKPWAGANRRRAQITYPTVPIVIGLSAIRKQYWQELSALCSEAAATDDPCVVDGALRLLESAPAELRRLRIEQSQLPREHSRWLASARCQSPSRVVCNSCR